MLRGELDPLSRDALLEVPRFAADLRRNGTVSTLAMMYLVNTEISVLEHMSRPFSALRDDEKRTLMAHRLMLHNGRMLTPWARAKFDRYPPERIPPELLAEAERAYEAPDELRLFESGRWRKRGPLGERERWRRRLEQLRVDLGPRYLAARERHDWKTCCDVLRQKVRSIREHPSSTPTDVWNDQREQLAAEDGKFADATRV